MTAPAVCLPSASVPAVAHAAASAERGLVSVIIPAYNAAHFLPETLQSACRQTYPSIEIIVVDDGSTDGTADAVRAATAADRRIRLIRQANAGVAAARNTAIEAARGEFLAPSMRTISGTPIT